ncbi:MAG TPA: glycerate kinase [Desulfomonilaceae bacterium]|nr:glycerate kinase [Desulfomonilaceae bacterium]
MKILVAPNALKGSVSAIEAAERIERGLKRSGLEMVLDLMPIADGGDDTMEVLTASGGTIHEVQVLDPLGRPITAHFGILADGRTAVVEMARASGLKLLEPSERNPLKTSTYGTGQLIAAAVKNGARRVIVGIGGSATNDGGVGCAIALGLRVLDETGMEVPGEGGSLARARRMDTEHMMPELRDTEIMIACDVDNPLLGPRGASAVFGPQKGATPEQVTELEANLSHFFGLVAQTLGTDVRHRPCAGAAGGLGGGLMTFLGGRPRSGIDLVLDYLNFQTRVSGIDLVITAEGRMDVQTLGGKGPLGIAKRAWEHGVPTIALAGSIGEGENQLVAAGFRGIFPIVPGPMSLEEAMKRGGELLESAAERVGRLLALSRKLT